MKGLRILTAILTIVISLMNLPAGLNPGGFDINPAIAWLFTGLGIVGIVAAVGLLRGTAWGTPVTAAVALANLIGSATAVAANIEGATLGLAISAALALALGAYVAASRRAQTSVA